METVTIKKADAIKAHKASDKATKKTLETLMPDVFQDIIARVEEAIEQCRKERKEPFYAICFIAGKDPWKYEVNDQMDDEETFAIYAKRCRLIALVLNQGAELTYHDDSTKKWTPVLVYTKTGFGFSDSYYGYSCTYACVAVRFASKERSDFAGKTFTQDFHNYYNSK